MTHIKYSSLYKYIFVFGLIVFLIYPASGHASQIKGYHNVYSYSGSKNHHHVKNISVGWEIFTPDRNLTATVNLPILAPANTNRITFSKTFKIEDSLRNRELIIWFPGIHGNASINVNNIQVLQRFNIPSGFKVQIPINLLNISGENNLDIVISKPGSPDVGIPNLVKIFKPHQNLGITGDIYLEWLPAVYFTDLNYTFEKNKLSFGYQLIIDKSYRETHEIYPKVRCEEEIRDPNGNVIYSRFEYLDLKAMTKKFNRSTFIINPLRWSSDSPEFYLLRLTAKSGSGLIAFHEQNIGLKQTSFNNHQMFINDTLLEIKGINYRLNHPIYTNVQDNSISAEEFLTELKEDFIDIKKLGFNSIRLPNTSPHPACLFLADSLGLYLFCENGLWRIPEPYFRNDQLLQISKKVADEILIQHSLHPSFTALGIGNEIPVHLPSVKKFMLILKGYIEQKSALPLYLTPLNIELISQGPVTEFYLCNKYDLSILTDFNEISNAEFYKQRESLIFGNVGFSVAHIEQKMDEINPEYVQSAHIQELLKLATNQANFGGYFLESYKDWNADIPARFGQQTISGKYVYPYGLIDHNGNKRDLYFQIPKLLNSDFSLPPAAKMLPDKSNFFSIAVLLISIAILFIYRRDYRFRENLKRSMAHPYGFFVDLRDRRIISILNSTIIGLYTNFLVSTLIAAYIYYMRDNILMEEMLSSILAPLQMKLFYLELIKSPLYISLIVWLSFYLLQLTIVILLKIINLLAKEKIRFKQYLAVCNWAGAPLFLLFPASMLSFHLMHFAPARPLIILILIIFFFWYNIRLGNGLRVLLSMRVYKIFVLLVLIYVGAIFAFGAIYESNYGLITYLHLLADAFPLF